MGFGLGLAGQGVKICVDTVGAGADRGRRLPGRVFSLYDMMFNVTYVAGPC
jgi:hypothetical protein